MTNPLTGVHEHSAGSPGPDGSFFSDLLRAYTPRQQCMEYDASVVWLHVVSDTLIAVAYFSIPLALIYFVRRRRDVDFSWMFVMFAAFILACGTTHVFGVAAIWRPLYRVDGLVKLVTAAVSVTTAVYLWKLVPTALKLPSPAQLREANRLLEREIADRKQAQEGEALLRNELEQRVETRTRELALRNDALQAEIGARREAERQRNELLTRERIARDEAELANRTKDEFLATLSHELRTPLNAIQGWSHLLRRAGVGRAEIDQGLEVIERNARIQTQLIGELLDMSRILSGKLRLDVQPVDLTQVIAAAVASIRPAADAKGVHVDTALDARATSIEGDPNRLQQVVWNLLSNAVKFTPTGGSVRVALASAGSRVEIAVIDTGAGIAPEFMPRLFERFTQADPTTTRAGGGLGLGLSIVRHLLELHGGTVTAQSDGEGRGSTFTVSLPLSTDRDAGSAEPPRSTAEAPSASQPDLSGVRVLVVDDEPDARVVIRRMLETCGADVTTASSVDEAWSRFRERRPTLVVSDIAMPGQDGYAFVRALRQLAPSDGGDVPAVALTAHASSDDRNRALRAGFQAHVVKPVEANELVTVVASLTGRARGATGAGEIES